MPRPGAGRDGLRGDALRPAYLEQERGPRAAAAWERGALRPWSSVPGSRGVRGIAPPPKSCARATSSTGPLPTGTSALHVVQAHALP